jgi:hypothetical protein
LLSDEATEQLQGPLAILLGEALPEPVQRNALGPARLRRKRGRTELAGMVPLLEWRYDKLGTNRRASKKQKPILPDDQARVDRGQLRASRLCSFCNSYKGPNISGLNPQTGRTVRLFNPRKDRWARHFEWNGPHLVGRTHTGRVTLALLEINRPEAVEFREYLILEGSFPPR